MCTKPQWFHLKKKLTLKREVPYIFNQVSSHNTKNSKVQVLGSVSKEYLGVGLTDYYILVFNTFSDGY